MKLIDFGSACSDDMKAHSYIQSRFYRREGGRKGAEGRGRTREAFVREEQKKKDFPRFRESGDFLERGGTSQFISKGASTVFPVRIFRTGFQLAISLRKLQKWWFLWRPFVNCT